ncbi:indolepyruvate oxidoreductase subunit beta [Candidatus Aenigmatarchaeota archaeon]
MKKKTDIIISGVGGQGILLTSDIISKAAIAEGLYVKQSFIKGLSQRRGEVFSQIRINHDHVYSPIIPPKGIDLLVGLEPLEALRFFDNLGSEGKAVVNIEKIDISGYPQNIDAHLNRKNVHTLNASEIAKKVGFIKAENMAVLGAASHFLPVSYDTLIDVIKNRVRKYVDKNLEAFSIGRNGVKV